MTRTGGCAARWYDGGVKTIALVVLGVGWLALGCGGTADGETAAGGGGTGGGGDECACVAKPISWGYDGGYVATRAESSIRGCNTFHHEVGPVEGEPTGSCETNLEECDVGLLTNVAMVNAALATADVKAAIAAAPILYGGDPRPVDGSVQRLDIGGKIIEVGSDCADSPDCAPLPTGVVQLAELLFNLEDQQLDINNCTL